LVNGTYSYKAIKTGYVNIEDSFTVENENLSVSIQWTGIESNRNENLSVYPNPVNSVLSVQSSKADIIEIQIVDLSGSVMECTIVNANQNTIDVSALSRGIYFVKIRTTNGNTVVRFVKL
jgi:hypothetical protein